MNFVEAYDLLKSVSSHWAHDNSYESRHEKTCLRGFRPGPTQSGLYSHR